MERVKKLMVSTAGGKAGAIDGLNLFFGALLGANLGTLEDLGVWDYLKIIFLLAGLVMTLRMVSTSPKRGQMVLTLACYGVIFAGVYWLPELRPKGMSQADLGKLAVTLGVWAGFVLLSEFMPTRNEPDTQSG